jgi:putative NADH-flavin reductase
MANPMIKIHNTETNEIIEREMTAEELQKHNEAIDAVEVAQAEAEAKATAKAALLTQLGITEEQASLLLG